MNRQKIGTRLQQVREQSGLGRATVCEKVGIGTTTLRQWEVGATEVSLETLEKLARLYKVSPQYLIFGTDGDTLPPMPIQSANDEDYKDVPIYDLAASAGTGKLVADENIRCYLKFPNWWFNERGLQHSDVVGLYTKGDSMEPTIPDNSLLLIDQSKTYLSDGKVYVVRVDDELYVKRVNRLVGEGLELISDNTRYKTKVISKELLHTENFFQVIGQVVHIGIDLPH